MSDHEEGEDTKEHELRPVDVARLMAEKVAARIQDPMQWLLECRRIAERLDLNVTRVTFHVRLESTCISICQYAAADGKTAQQMLDAAD